MSFKKTKENFVCSHCGFNVIGTGYTNHCPKCLWSKHVDIEPGDRFSECGGMMRPIGVEGSTGKGYMLVQKCEKCGHTRRNAVQEEDDIEAVLTLAAKQR